MMKTISKRNINSTKWILRRIYFISKTNFIRTNYAFQKKVKNVSFNMLMMNMLKEKIHKTYDLLYKSIFIFRMKKMIIQYVIACSICQLFKPSRQLSYEKLQSLKIFVKSLTKFSLNFIVTLFMIFNDNNVIMSITNRFTKYVKTISNNEKMKIEKWKYLYWKFVFKDWKTSIKLINDKNFKFNSDFWLIVFKQCEISLKMITAYHSSTDEQTEKTNQIIETSFRFLLVKKYKKKWNKMLFQIEYVLNIFENASTKVSSFEILYEVKPKDFLMKIIRKNLSDAKIKFLKNKRQIKTNVINAVKMTQTKMTIQFDKKHRPPNLKKQIYLKMIKTKKSKYYLSKTNSLSTKKLRSFLLSEKSIFWHMNLTCRIF